MPTSDFVADRAAAYAEAGTYWGEGYCLRFARTCAGAPVAAPDAITAWRNARYRHLTGTPPRGSFVFWSGGSAGHGHITVSDGHGWCWSTDIVRRGRVDRYPISKIVAKWPNLKYLGWSEDVNGVRVSGLAATAPTVSLANLRPNTRHDDVTDLQLALRRHGQIRLNPSGATGYFGDETRAMTRAFQRAQHWTGTDADGIPGPRTCALLGLHID